MFPLTNKTYDTLKWLAQIVLPSLAALYFGLSAIWNFPYTSEIVGTLTGISVFVGAILGLSTKQYYSDETMKAERVYAKNVYDQTAYYESSPFLVPPQVYEVIKWVVLIVLPAAGTLYFTLSQLWALPYAEQVQGTIAVVTTFLGIMMGVSTSKFEKIAKPENYYVDF